MALIDDVLNEINIISKMRWSPSLHVVTQLQLLANKVTHAIKTNADSIVTTKATDPKPTTTKNVVSMPSKVAAKSVAPSAPTITNKNMITKPVIQKLSDKSNVASAQIPLSANAAKTPTHTPTHNAHDIAQASAQKAAENKMSARATIQTPTQSHFTPNVSVKT